MIKLINKQEGLTMTKLAKVIKLIKYLKKHDSSFYLDHWEVVKGKLYRLSWDVDPHNGDIDDFTQELVKNNDQLPRPEGL